MPRYIIKPDRDREVYVEWSSIVEAPVWVASSREKAIRKAGDPDRVDRADRYGTSSHSREGGWGDPGEIYRQEGWIPRSRLGVLADRLLVDPSADVSDLLDPFDDDEEDA